MKLNPGEVLGWSFYGSSDSTTSRRNWENIIPRKNVRVMKDGSVNKLKYNSDKRTPLRSMNIHTRTVVVPLRRHSHITVLCCLGKCLVSVRNGDGFGLEKGQVNRMVWRTTLSRITAKKHLDQSR